MSCYGAREMEASFRTVRKNTVIIAEEIPEEQYGYRATPDVMSVAEMLAHIAIGTRWQQDVHTSRLSEFPLELYVQYTRDTAAAEQQLTDKTQILVALREEGERFASFLGALTDDVLAERVAFTAPLHTSKSRFEMLLGVKEHEMHHRSQLMLIQRLLGQVPHLTRQRQAMAAQQPQA